MTTLLSDPRVGRVPLRDDGQPLVALDPGFGDGPGLGRLVRLDVALRLGEARSALPSGYGLTVVEGFRTPGAPAGDHRGVRRTRSVVPTRGRTTPRCTG